MPSKLYIIVDSGCVSSVRSENPERFEDVEVVVVDYDIQGLDEIHLSEVDQGDGYTLPAAVWRERVMLTKITVEA